MVKIINKVLTSFPDEDALENGGFKGTMFVTAIFYDINPVLIIEEHPENKGPDLTIAIDYYGPDMAAQLGMRVERTKFIVKSFGDLDDEYIEVTLPELSKDPWGRYHAGSGSVDWTPIGRERFHLICKDLGKEPSKYLGKIGIFLLQNTSIKTGVIKGYDGQNYYYSDNEIAQGKLIGVD